MWSVGNIVGENDTREDFEIDWFIQLNKLESEWETKQVSQMDKYKSEGGRGEKQKKGRNEERNAGKDDPKEGGKVRDKETAVKATRDWWLERKRDMGKRSKRYMYMYTYM